MIQSILLHFATKNYQPSLCACLVSFCRLNLDSGVTIMRNDYENICVLSCFRALSHHLVFHSLLAPISRIAIVLTSGFTFHGFYCQQFEVCLLYTYPIWAQALCYPVSQKDSRPAVSLGVRTSCHGGSVIHVSHKEDIGRSSCILIGVQAFLISLHFQEAHWASLPFILLYSEMHSFHIEKKGSYNFFNTKCAPFFCLCPKT